MPKEKVLNLEQITVTGQSQPRHALSKEAIEDYRERYEAGDEAPPLVVFHDGETWWLSCGFHRYNAAIKAGRQSHKCIVHNGGPDEALDFGYSENLGHGVRMTHADKRSYIERLLDRDEASEWTSQDIADIAKCSRQWVHQIMQEREGESRAAAPSRAEGPFDQPDDDGDEPAPFDDDYEPVGGDQPSEIDVRISELQAIHKDAKANLRSAKKLINKLEGESYFQPSIGRVRKYVNDAISAIHQMEPVQHDDGVLLTRNDVQSKG